MKRAASLGLVTVVAVTFAACGGSSGGGATAAASPASARSCLGKAGWEIDEQLDYIAEDASGGGFRIFNSDKEAMVMFVSGDSEADDLADAYSVFGGQMQRNGSALVAWTDEPSSEERSAVASCLGG